MRIDGIVGSLLLAAGVHTINFDGLTATDLRQGPLDRI